MAENIKFYDDHYDVVVIGGALAGLSSAMMLAKKGLKVLVLEQHNLPGGCATSFVRGGVEIEGTLHEMMSIGEKVDGKHELKVGAYFDEMGVDVDWIRVPEAYRLVTPDVSVVVHAGKHGDFSIPAKEIAAACEDKDGKIEKELLRFFDACNKVYNSVNALGVKMVSKPAMLAKHNTFVRTAGYNAEEVLNTFDLPQRAKDILSAYWIYVGSPLYELPFTIFAFLLADYLGYGSYIPGKCSHEMSLKMQMAAEALGAQIEFGQRVDKILVKDHKVRGVRTARGDEIACDYVISGSYPNKVYAQMIEPKEEAPKASFKYSNAKHIGVTCFSVVMLLDKSPEELGITDYSTFYAPKGMDFKELWSNNCTSGPYNYITSICTNLGHRKASPEGTCIYSITTLPDPEGWAGVTEENYEEMKRKNAEHFIEMESKRLGVNLKDHILEIVIESPVTIAHYTGAWKGSIYGFRHTMDDHVVARLTMHHGERYIDGLAFAGAHQVSGDGMGPAVTNGRKGAKDVLDEIAERKAAKQSRRAK